MKYRSSFQDDNQQPPGPAQVATSEVLNQEAMDYAPSPDEVARRAYFSYENEGSRPGRDVQHWLSAEADLIAERNRTRVHGFHNQT
jgi:hypothetical protein